MLNKLRKTPELTPTEIKNLLLVALVKAGVTSIEINSEDVEKADGTTLVLVDLGNTIKLSLKND